MQKKHKSQRNNRLTTPKTHETTRHRWPLGETERAADMAALAHHRVLSFTSSATPRTRLPCASSSPPPTHARLRGARVLRHASSGSSSAAPASSSSLEELSRSCTTWLWRGMRVNYLVRGEGPPVLLVHGFGASVAHWRR